MSVRIGIGSGLAPSFPADAFWRWIALCEEGGIDSIWPSDQLLGPGLEPLTMLAALAAATRRLRLGTNALFLSFRDPLVLAKQLATIDFLSAGRFFPSFNIAAQWDHFWAATSRSSAERGSQANEFIALLRRLLEQDQVSFEGKHFRFKGPGVQPKPDKPLSLWIGGESEAAVRRTALLGDGWLGGLSAPSKAGEVVSRIKAALLETGRMIEADHYGVSLPFRLSRADDPVVIATRDRLAARLKFGSDREIPECFAVGSPDDIIGLIRQYIETGISKFVLLPIVRDGNDMIEQTRLIIREILPTIHGQRLAD